MSIKIIMITIISIKIAMGWDPCCVNSDGMICDVDLEHRDDIVVTSFCAANVTFAHLAPS